MKNTHNGYGSSNMRQEWLPSQNWQEIAKKRQEKIAVAEAERAYKEKILKRRIVLTLFVLGTIGVVAPAAIYPRLSYADALDASMGYTLAQEARITFGSRLDNADAIVSDGSAFLDETPAEAPAATVDGQVAQQDPVAFGEYGTPAPVDEQQQVTPPADQTAIIEQQPQQEAWSQPDPPLSEEPYVAEPAPVIAEQAVSSVQAESVPSVDVSTTVAVEPTVTQSDEPNWWSVPSWSSASAPQYDALGIWDVHYYIAHNWTSYGEVILNLRKGDTLSIDGQRLMVVDSAYFSAGTDYEAVRARFGWDVWCVQTCYGETQVRVVSMVPIS